MNALVATTYGNGPFTPTIVYQGKSYAVAPAMDEIEQAMEQAILIASQLRDQMRAELPKGYRW